MKWVEFWDTFDKLVHGDLTMTYTQKFIYLKALLTGDEFSFIKNMGIDDDNYERAVTILKSRYGNFVKLVSLHKTALLDMKPVNRNCSNLREFFQDMESHICALETLKVETDCSSLLIPLLNKLPLDLIQRIYKKQQLVDGDLISMGALRDELSLELQSI